MNTIAVPTKNRTAAFRRCLASLKDNAKKYDRDIQFLIVDDSTDGSNPDNYKALQEVGLPFRYYDRQFIAAFADYLGQKAGCRELTRFALSRSPMAYGAVRNALMLMSANDPFVMVDDDMICKFANVPRIDGVKLDLRPRMAFQNMRVIDGVEESELVDVDFLGAHEQAFEQVPLTCGGSIGDSGIQTNYVYLICDTVLDQLAESPPQKVPELMRKRQMLRVDSQSRVVNWVCSVGMNMGLDPTQGVLPPYLPIGRSEDVLFGAMLQNCCHRRSAYLNHAMWHTRHRATDLETELKEFLNPVLGDFFYSLLVEVNPVDLDMFGQTLSCLSHTDLSWVLDNWRNRMIAILERNTTGKSEPLAEEMHRLIGVLKAAPMVCTVPPQVIKDYGELLMTWPRIYEVAQDYGKQLQIRLRASSV